MTIIMPTIDDRTNLTDSDVYGPDKPEHRPSGIVLHHTGDQGVNSEEGTIAYLSHKHGPKSTWVSVDKLFRRNGTIVKIVPESQQAWHAGYSYWGGIDGCNKFLGYEISNRGLGKAVEVYTNEEYESVALSVAYDTALYRIPDSMCTSHRRCADEWVRHFPIKAKLLRVSLGRKTDPRDWDWLRMWKRVDEIRADWPTNWPPLWYINSGRIMST